MGSKRQGGEQNPRRVDDELPRLRHITPNDTSNSGLPCVCRSDRDVVPFTICRKLCVSEVVQIT